MNQTLQPNIKPPPTCFGWQLCMPSMSLVIAFLIFTRIQKSIKHTQWALCIYQTKWESCTLLIMINLDELLFLSHFLLGISPNTFPAPLKSPQFFSNQVRRERESRFPKRERLRGGSTHRLNRLLQSAKIWAMKTLSSTWMLRVANSTPIVDLDSRLNSFLVNLESKIDFLIAWIVHQHCFEQELIISYIRHRFCDNFFVPSLSQNDAVWSHCRVVVSPSPQEPLIRG